MNRLVFCFLVLILGVDPVLAQNPASDEILSDGEGEWLYYLPELGRPAPLRIREWSPKNFEVRFFDGDRDGRGDPTRPKLFRKDAPEDPSWVKDGTDCDPKTAEFFQTIGDICEDCDLDGVAESAAKTVCVGKSKFAIWERIEDGKVIVGVTVFYESANGRWRLASEMLRDEEGNLILDQVLGRACNIK